MRRTKHLSSESIPLIDREVFSWAYAPGDVFEETDGRGARLAFGTRRMIDISYRRWLGFLFEKHPHELALAPAERITRSRVREYVDFLLTDMKPVSAAICLQGLHYAANFAEPLRDWGWLVAIAARLRSRTVGEDRFTMLVPGWLTLDYGIGLMDEAPQSQALAPLERDILYRDGLILALLSCWPLRRRSIAALAVRRHLDICHDHVYLRLYPQDMKTKRAACYLLHERLVPYLLRYLKDVRPRLLRQAQHDGLWASRNNRPLSHGRLYDVVRLHTRRGFGKAMGLHDFRRAAATFLATDAPELVGCIPGTLQHTSPEVAERYYNLARSVTASQRFADHVARARHELRLRLGPDHPARGKV